MRARRFAVIAAIAVSGMLFSTAPAASADPPATPAFAYGLWARALWGGHDNILEPAHFDVIPSGRNIGVSILAGPSFGRITILSTLDAKGVPLVSYRTISKFFTGSDSFLYRLIDLDTGEPLDEGVAVISIMEDGDPDTTEPQYATYTSPNDGGGGTSGAGGAITSAVAGDGQIALTWPANAGSILRVYDGLTLRRINVSGLTSMTVTGLTNGTSYWFRLANEPYGSAYEVGATGPLVPLAAVVPPASDPVATPPVKSAGPSAPSVTVSETPVANPTPTATPTALPSSSPTTPSPGDSSAASPVAEPQSSQLSIWIWLALAAILLVVAAGFVVRLWRARL